MASPGVTTWLPVGSSSSMPFSSCSTVFGSYSGGGAILETLNILLAVGKYDADDLTWTDLQSAEEQHSEIGRGHVMSHSRPRGSDAMQCSPQDLAVK